LSESINPWVYSLQFLYKFTNNSWRSERKCEWVFFSEHSVYKVVILSSTQLVQRIHSLSGLDWIVQCFMSLPTQYRLSGRQFFTGQKTQPTVSKYWTNK